MVFRGLVFFFILMPPVAFAGAISTRPIDGVKSIEDFKGAYYYEVKTSDEEPPTASDCAKLDQAQIKRFASYGCKRQDDSTSMFEDWSCSKTKTDRSWVSVVIGAASKCEKALEQFRARY